MDLKPLGGIFSADFRWNQYLAWARVLLGFSALANEIFRSPEPSGWFSVAIGIFVAYGLVLAAKDRAYRGTFGLLTLFLDTVFFLILANHGAGRSLWLASVLYLYLLSEAVAFYSPHEVLIVATVCTAFCAVAPGTYLTLLERTAVIAGTLACAFAVGKRRLQNRIEELMREVKMAQEEASKARDAERQRIASDFHDGPLQSYISFQMRLEVMRKLLERDRATGMEELQQLQGLALAQVRELRAFVRSMRPMDLDGANLFAAARRIAEAFQKDSGIPVTFVGGDTPPSIPQETSAEVLQMLREALHNVQKHAGATRVAVALEKVGKILEMSVDDNGRGFQFSGTYNLEELELLRLGPASLKRRTRALNAGLVLESQPGRGSGLKWKIPLH